MVSGDRLQDIELNPIENPDALGLKLRLKLSYVSYVKVENVTTLVD